MLYLDIATRVFLGVIFTTALYSKLRSRRAWGNFKNSLTEFGIAPSPILAATAAGVEVLIVALLAIPGTSSAGYFLATATLLAFTGATAKALRAGRTVRCHCFGTRHDSVGAGYFARNGFLVLSAVFGWIAALQVSGSPSLPAIVVAAGLGCLTAAALLLSDDVITIWRV